MCAWWDDDAGTWSSDGCRVGEPSAENLECLCTHLTLSPGEPGGKQQRVTGPGELYGAFRGVYSYKALRCTQYAERLKQKTEHPKIVCTP